LGGTVGHTLISSINGMWMAFWLVALGSVSATGQPDRIFANPNPGVPTDMK
jgi:hypothetical protein